MGRLTTKVKITADRARRMSCSAVVPETYAERVGKEIEIYIRPVTEAPPEVEACQSKFYWQVVVDDPGRWWVCEHAIDCD